MKDVVLEIRSMRIEVESSGSIKVVHKDNPEVSIVVSARDKVLEVWAGGNFIKLEPERVSGDGGNHYRKCVVRES